MKKIALYVVAVFLAAMFSLTSFAQTPATGEKQSQRQRKSEKMFGRLDANSDGRISREEWTQNDKGFARLDANNDGFITQDEAAALGKQQRKHRGKNQQGNFTELDKNNDGQISREEWTRKPEAFDRFDSNKDGLLTQDELKKVRPRKN